MINEVSINVMCACMDQLLEVISILCGRSIETNVPNPQSSFYIEGFLCSVCCCTSEDDYSCSYITQRLQSGKSLDSGLERLFVYYTKFAKV